MEISDFIGLFSRMKERQIEEKVWEMWLVKLPWMDENSFISYEEMLNTARQIEIKPELSEKPINGVYVDQCFF